VLYLQLQTSFGSQDVRGDEKRAMQRNSEDSAVCSLKSLSSDGSKTVAI